MKKIYCHDDALKSIEDTTPQFASEILRRLTFHFIQPKEHKKRSKEDTNILLAALNKSCILIEKQIPMKPIEQELRENDHVRIGKCASCNEWWVSEFKKYCPGCGQAIDWSKEDSDATGS